MSIQNKTIGTLVILPSIMYFKKSINGIDQKLTLVKLLIFLEIKWINLCILKFIKKTSWKCRPLSKGKHSFVVYTLVSYL